MGCLKHYPLWASLLIGSLLFGCSSLPRDPVPPAYADKVAVLDGTQVRYWGDRAPSNINALAAEKWARLGLRGHIYSSRAQDHRLAFLRFPAVVRTGHSGQAFWLAGPRAATDPSSTS
jgi:hypothetical protein